MRSIREIADDVYEQMHGLTTPVDRKRLDSEDQWAMDFAESVAARVLAESILDRARPVIGANGLPFESQAGSGVETPAAGALAPPACDAGVTRQSMMHVSV